MNISCLSHSNAETTRVAGQKFRYRQLGSGELLVLVPPPIADFRIFCNLQDRLASKFKTVAIDLPKADNSNEAISKLTHLIDKGTNQEFHLFASSASGFLIQYVAQNFSDQLHSLILINSIWDNNDYRSKYRRGFQATKLVPGFKFKGEAIDFSKKLTRGIKSREEINNYFEERVKTLGKGGVRQQLSWFLEEKETPPRPLNIPVLIGYSKNDPVIPRSEREKLLKNYSHAETVIFDGDAHLPYYSHPAKFDEELIKFIQSS